MAKNPFTLMFGVDAESIIYRVQEFNSIVQSFSEQDSMYSFLITGIRGSGKTVLLRAVENHFREDEEWAVININPQGSMMQSLANRLFDTAKASKIIGRWSIALNLQVLTLTMESGAQTSDPELIIEKIVSRFAETKKKVLISIDEVNDTNQFRQFINFYQILLGRRMPVYLAMTALPENVDALVNDKAMTFLSRVPKIELKPLELVSVAAEYKMVFGIDNATAAAMAKLTQGYAFAYQVLGYFFFEAGGKTLSDALVEKYVSYLYGNGYAKFWNDLTGKEKEFMIALAASESGEKEQIIANGFPPNSYSLYRKRLMDKGLLWSPKYDCLMFVLPKFKEYVEIAKQFE